jgi:hypothetical protein
MYMPAHASMYAHACKYMHVHKVANSHNIMQDLVAYPQYKETK